MVVPDPSTFFPASEFADRGVREAGSRPASVSCLWGLWPAVGHRAPQVPVQTHTFCSLAEVSRKVLPARWLLFLTAVQHTGKGGMVPAQWCLTTQLTYVRLGCRDFCQNLAAEEGSHATALEMNRGALCRAESHREHIAGVGLCKQLLPGSQGSRAPLQMSPSAPITGQLNSDSVRSGEALGQASQAASQSPGCDLRQGN